MTALQRLAQMAKSAQEPYGILKVPPEELYRFDDKKINEFKKNTYYRNKDWSSSGTFSSQEKIPSDWIQEQGLFAGDLKNVISFSVPRKTKWLRALLNSERPTIFLDNKDKEKIKKHVSYLSSFNKADFEKLPSGEYFSRNQPKPLRQEVITNPLVLLKKHHNVEFVNDLLASKKELERKNIKFDSEGF